MKRTKDARGNYFCAPCWAEALSKREARLQSASPTTCVTRVAPVLAVPRLQETVAQSKKAAQPQLVRIGVIAGFLVVLGVVCLAVWRDSSENQRRQVEQTAQRVRAEQEQQERVQQEEE